MTIRTRAFIGLWLLSIVAVGAIAFVIYAINVASSMDAERLRIAQIMDLQGSMARALVEMKHEQLNYSQTNLESLRDRIEQRRRSFADYRARLSQLVQDPEQVERMSHLGESVDRWVTAWSQASREPATAAPVALFEASEQDFAPINTMLVEFADRERLLWNQAQDTLMARRRLFFTIVSSIGLIGVIVLALVVVSAKRSVLDPLTDLTDSARRIEQGDFTAAQQTLRADEIGVLFNSFAKMVQAS